MAPKYFSGLCVNMSADAVFTIQPVKFVLPLNFLATVYTR